MARRARLCVVGICLLVILSRSLKLDLVRRGRVGGGANEDVVRIRGLSVADGISAIFVSGEARE